MFIIFLYMFRALCAHYQEVKTVLYSIRYHHTERSEWSKITKIQFYKYEHINVTTMCSYLQNCILVILDHLLVSV